ncbi:GspE/PulE family protein [Novosphingobium huizhouense]|uniref:GspE/PulE family protein n=1 Tax=Novosphingobium huizhouense TaxID=2866625 RepID=UPI001CD8C476|nr:GspE/PulE family protein [Novosphingobium huizhouense]
MPPLADHADAAKASPAPASSGLADVLRREASLSDEALSRAILVETETGETLDKVATRLGLVSEDALAQALGRATGLPLIDAVHFPDAAPAIADVSTAFLRDRRIVPLSFDGSYLRVAMANPLDDEAVAGIGFAAGCPVLRTIARGGDIDAAIDRLYRTETEEGVEDEVDEADLEHLKDLVSDAPVIRAVNRLIADAVDAKASDIHLEPTDDRLAVRFRIDGVLREMSPKPAAMRAPIVSRIKVMANLNIAERRLPQDGRLRLTVRGHEIDLRVATAPSIHGESVVMRILDKSNLALDPKTLGFDADLEAQFLDALSQPHGIMLVTGPTGSGKTTTLYAALAHLNSHERKLTTIEDPIEYRLPGVVQSQVNPTIGYTFSSALRSFLRQDPDVMMVGEIRDTETAQIAVQAALTGHMILSTLHTNTAAGAVTRLLDMGVEPFLLSSVLTGVLAQRLVRRLCPHCREPFKADKSVLARLGVAKGDGEDGWRTFYRPVGCPECRNSGYSGRMAVFEFIRIDADLSQLILHRADTRKIAQAAAKAGFGTLRSDGVDKARRGLTTLEEVLRVSSED